MKNLYKWCTALVIFGSITTHNAFAQSHYEAFLERAEAQTFNQNVFTVTAADQNEVQMFLGKAATNIFIDTEALIDYSDFLLELPGLSDLYAVKEKTIINQLGGKNWIGDVVFLDPYGFDTAIQGRAYFVETDEGLTGVINTQDEVIQIYPDGSGGQLVVRSAPEAFDTENDTLDGGINTEPTAAPSVGGIRDGVSPATLESPYTIDIMFVVTDRVAQISDEQANIETMLTIGNDVLANSLVPARLRNVETYYTNYVEEDNLSDDLRRLRDPNDGYMDDIHARRDEVGADLVMLVSDSNNYCGIAYLDAASAWAFSATFTGCMTTYTPIHELGHNFGAQHDVENGSNYFYSFGYGIYNNTIDPYWRTVMSYQCPGGGCGRAPYFSTPLLTYNDLPLGDPETADNARVLKIRVGEVAGYYPSTTPYCNEFTATNDEHVTAGRAFTETETVCTLEFFGNCYQTRTDTLYIATGSEDDLGTNNGSSTTTLFENPSNFYSLTNSCGTIGGELPFAPEIQNIQVTSLAASLDISGEVFDANADDIVSIEAKPSISSTWTSATLSTGGFEVEVPNTNYGDVSFDFRTTDDTGESFTFSIMLEHQVGEPPTIEADSPLVYDSTVQISGESIDPDSDVIEIRYQIDGDGNPETGEWLSIPIQNRFWSIEITDVPLGLRTIDLYGVDESSQISNVVRLDVEIIPGVAPECIFADAIPSTSGLEGEVEITGLVSDVNGSDVTLEYSIDSGAWTAFEEYSRLTYRPVWSHQIQSLIVPDNTIVNIDVRALDSSGLQTDCGTVIYSTNYPETDEPPSCEFIEVEKYDGNLRYFFSTSDPNGNQQQMYAKEASSEEWLQTWPNTVAGGLIPIPGIGEFTIQGRVVDSTGLEGICETQFTVIDEGFTPEIESAFGYFETEENSVVISARAVDMDGDVVLVEARAAGSSEWLAMEKVDIFGNHRLLLGLIPNGIYSYEVRATDSGGRVSDIAIADFEIDREIAPELSDITYDLAIRQLTVNGSAFDGNDDLDRIYLKLDDRDWTSIAGAASWTATFIELQDGAHTLLIYAEDNRGNQSAQETINFDLDPGSTPLVDSLTITTSEDSATLTVNASDIDGDLAEVYVSLDGGSFVLYNTPSSPGVWTINFTGLSAGSHQVQIYANDVYGNVSPTQTQNFSIEQLQACYESTNAQHEDLGRATSDTVCQYVLFGNCYNPTTTYYAVGSNDNLGTNANAVTALLESSPGFFEQVSECSTADTTKPVITVLGDNPLELSVGESFIDPGATATDNVDGSVTVNVSGLEEVDTSSEGTFTITYTAVDAAGNEATPQTRTVNVLPDTIAPVITLLGDNPMMILLGSDYTEPEATAVDNVDGDISVNIVITGTVDTSTEGQYFITYNVSDAAGNLASATREVNVVADAVAPVITLIGDANMSVDINTQFTDPGATALDDVDGDISEQIQVSGTVDTSTAGTYLLRYNVIDNAGNPAEEVVRSVEVVDGPACFESTLSAHVGEGRAYEQYYSYYSTGTGTYLGSTFNDANKVISLEEISSGNWSQVSSCN